MNRRTFVRSVVGAGAALFTVACGGGAPPAPTAAPAAKPAAAPAAAPTSAPAAPAAAAPAPAAPTAPPARESWTVGLNAEASGLDAAIFGGVPTDIVLGHLMDGLVDNIGPELKLVPKLATAWSRVDDLTWRFTLRQGVKFHDGTEMKAEDVKYSFELYKKKEAYRTPYTRQMAEFRVVDPYTIDVVTTQPSSIFLPDMSRLFVLPKAARESMGPEAFNKKPIGTGPYKVVSWTPNDRLVLEAHQDYWRGPVRPKSLTLRPITDPTTRVAELLSGGVDLISNPTPAQLGDISKNPQTELLVSKGARGIVYLFSVTKPPFNNVRVRQALNYAVDRKTLLDTVIGGHGILLNGPLSQGWMGYLKDQQPYPYDPKKAKELLAEAGLPNGFSTSWKHTKGAYLADAEIAQAVAGQLRQVGVQVELIPSELSQNQKDQAEGNFDGLISGAWAVQADPDAMMNWYFVDKPHFVNPKLQPLALAARAEADPAKRLKLLQDFNRTAHDEANWLEIHAQDEFWAKRKEVPWKVDLFQNSLGYSYYFDTSGLKPLG